MTRLILQVLLLIIRNISIHAEEKWPGFRGKGDSVSAAKKLPIAWEQRGLAGWTTRLIGYGQSSPVVWNKQVFVTSVSGDEKENLHVTAIDLDSGRSLWRRDFSATQKVRDSDTVSRGAPTPVVDAERVYAAFESGDIVALSLAGESLWQRSFVKDYGEIKGPHGYASSPILIDDLLILQVCHSGASYILALDSKTGINRWKVNHPSQTGWSSPASYRNGQTTGIIISTAGSVRAFNAKNGDELWSVTGLIGNSTSSPTVDGDVVVIGASERGGGEARRGGGDNNWKGTRQTTGETRNDREATPNKSETAALASNLSPGSLAIRLGGQGDVTQTHVVWRSPKVLVGYASPLVYEGLIYFTNKVGVVQCADLKSGDVKWQHRLPGQMWASAVACNGHVFFFSKEGEVVVLKAGAERHVVAENTISVTDIVYGVAAIDDAWLVRTGRSLIKISASIERPETITEK